MAQSQRRGRQPAILGDRKMVRELGEAYTESCERCTKVASPAVQIWCCYWFEKARTALEIHWLGRCGTGFDTTPFAAGGAQSRKVLEAIVKTSRIYEAWSDEGLGE